MKPITKPPVSPPPLLPEPEPRWHDAAPLIVTIIVGLGCVGALTYVVLQ